MGARSEEQKIICPQSDRHTSARRHAINGRNCLALIDATALSVNTVYAQVVDRIGAAKLDAMAEALGISRGYVDVLLHRARASLFACMTE